MWSYGTTPSLQWTSTGTRRAGNGPALRVQSAAVKRERAASAAEGSRIFGTWERVSVRSS